MEIYAWVLMPNHFHLLCKTKNLSLASGMRRILTGYVVNFNKRHRKYGHLFQNRYKSIVCREDVYLKKLVRYIHLNQLRAGIVKDLKELNRNLCPVIQHLPKRCLKDIMFLLVNFGQEVEEDRLSKPGV